MEFEEFDCDEFLYCSPVIQAIEQPSGSIAPLDFESHQAVKQELFDSRKQQEAGHHKEEEEEDILIPGTPEQLFDFSCEPSTANTRTSLAPVQRHIMATNENGDHHYNNLHDTRVSLVIDSSSSESEAKLVISDPDCVTIDVAPREAPKTLYVEELGLEDLDWDEDDLLKDMLSAPQAKPAPLLATHASEKAVYCSPLSSSPVYISPIAQSRVLRTESIALAAGTADSALFDPQGAAYLRSRPDEPYYHSDEPLSPLRQFYTLEDLEKRPELNYMAEYFKGQFGSASKRTRRRAQTDPESVVTPAGGRRSRVMTEDGSRSKGRASLLGTVRKRSSYPGAHSAIEGSEHGEFVGSEEEMVREDSEEASAKRKKKWPSNYAVFRRRRNYGRKSIGD